MSDCDKCGKFCFGDETLCINCQIAAKKRREHELSNVRANQPSLADLTEKYINEGESEENAYNYACEDRGCPEKKVFSR